MRGRGGGEGVRTRDHLASVRTTLVWVRTGLVLMGIGYSLDKLAVLEGLYAAGGGLGRYGRALGLLTLGGGVVLCAAALPRFLRARTLIESARLVPRPGADLALVGVVAGVALAVLVALGVSR